MLAQLRELEAEFLDAGVKVACVVQAHPDQLPKECTAARHLTCVPDPKRESYRAMGLGKMSLWKIFTAGDLWRRRKHAAARGFKQNWKKTFARESDGLLLPGAALIGPRGKILWIYRGEHTGDLPPADALLAVVQEHWDPKASESRPST